MSNHGRAASTSQFDLQSGPEAFDIHVRTFLQQLVFSGNPTFIQLTRDGVFKLKISAGVSDAVSSLFYSTLPMKWQLSVRQDITDLELMRGLFFLFVFPLPSHLERGLYQDRPYQYGLLYCWA